MSRPRRKPDNSDDFKRAIAETGYFDRDKHASVLALDPDPWAVMAHESIPGAREDYWREHSEEIVKDYAKRFPGRRPHDWWKYSAPDLRRIVSREEFRPTMDFGFGRPGWAVPGDAVESQASFLKRHGLFLPGEEKRLTLADFEPEAIEEDC